MIFSLCLPVLPAEILGLKVDGLLAPQCALNLCVWAVVLLLSFQEPLFLVTNNNNCGSVSFYVHVSEVRV